MSAVFLHLIAALVSASPTPSPIYAEADTLWRVGLTRGVFLDTSQRNVPMGSKTSTSPWIRTASGNVLAEIRKIKHSVPSDRNFRLHVLASELDGAFNSDLPLSINEGSLWAGRGLSGRSQVGAALSYGSVTAVLAPEIWGSQNRDFQTFSYPENVPRPGDVEDRMRHPLASPFHYPPHSIDLPQRLGYDSGMSLGLGQSSLSWESASVRIGITTESLRWGPSIRNPLLVSNNAQGFRRLFAQTTKPFESPIGDVHAQWILGRLEESSYFDNDPDNNHRSLSGVIVTLNPSFEPNLSMGIGRVVYAPALGFMDLPTAAFDFVRPVGPVASETSGEQRPLGPDRIFSVFAHWSFPDAGLETWIEWGRSEEPRSLRDFLETPHHSRGYTLGLRHTQPTTSSARLAIEAEITSLEPSQSFRLKQHGEWYTSRRVIQGYTHRGRVIGAGIGPSGSGQWLAVDWVAPRWNLGLFGTRIRLENEALYSYFPEYRRADLTLLAGVRGAGKIGPFRFEAAWAESIRLNYLFQAKPLPNDAYRGVDLRNRILRLSLSATGA